MQIETSANIKHTATCLTKSPETEERQRDWRAQWPGPHPQANAALLTLCCVSLSLLLSDLWIQVTLDSPLTQSPAVPSRHSLPGDSQPWGCSLSSLPYSSQPSRSRLSPWKRELTRFLPRTRLGLRSGTHNLLCRGWTLYSRDLKWDIRRCAVGVCSPNVPQTSHDITRKRTLDCEALQGLFEHQSVGVHDAGMCNAAASSAETKQAITRALVHGGWAQIGCVDEVGWGVVMLSLISRLLGGAGNKHVHVRVGWETNYDPAWPTHSR